MWFVTGMLASWVTATVIAMINSSPITPIWIMLQIGAGIAVGIIWHLLWSD